MVLMVSLRARISPFTSTVIFFDRSPFATAVVTSAMLRTWPVRLPAMRFTLSVRSAQVPATPSTCAWPPSLPSAPTSRATRVTSEANAFSWSTIVLMVYLSSRISPRTSTVIFFDKSPLATAVVTSAMLRTCAVRLPAMELTLSVKSFQVPATPLTSACPPSFPSVPTSRATRVNCDFRGYVSGRHGFGDGGDIADLICQVTGHQIDVLRQIFPRACNAFDVCLAAQLAFCAHRTRHACYFGRKSAELTHHCIYDS